MQLQLVSGLRLRSERDYYASALVSELVYSLLDWGRKRLPEMTTALLSVSELGQTLDVSPLAMG